jgi:hypothetical protein
MKRCPECDAISPDSAVACAGCGCSLRTGLQHLHPSAIMGAITEWEWLGRLREDLTLESSWPGRLWVVIGAIVRRFGLAVLLVLAIGALVLVTLEANRP